MAQNCITFGHIASDDSRCQVEMHLGLVHTIQQYELARIHGGTKPQHARPFKNQSGKLSRREFVL
jgi:hypothetical protein